MKAKRHAKILEIITAGVINTQEELLKRLNDMGFKATQATISRDIKELRLIKTQNENGQYKYAVAAQNEISNNTSKFITIFTESVINVNYAMNIVVIKCFTGMANAVCILLDSMTWERIVGTLSGDDTIFILMQNEEMASQMVQRLEKMIVAP